MTADTVAPTLAITASDSNLSAGEATTITFTFSEAPVGFVAGDVSVAGGALSGFAATGNPLVYTATFTQSGATAPSVTVANSTYTDAAGNNGIGNTLNMTADTVAPTLNAQSFSYTENSAANTVVANVASSDNVGVVSYKFSATGTNTSADGFYQISNAGVVTLTMAGAGSAANDFETGSAAHAYSVIVADSAGNTTTNTMTFNETNVNDAPVNTVPSTQTTNEDATKAITGLSITDVDAGASSMTVTLAMTNGTLTVSGGTAAIAGSGTNSVTLTGTVAQINATLAATVSYVPTGNFSGAATLTMTTNDNGNTGPGGALTDVDSTTINVTAVADAPTLNGITQIYSITTPALTSTDGASGILQANIETALGLTTGVLDTFNPPPGVLNSPGNVNVNSGTYSTNSLTLSAGQNISFDWGFYNGENLANEITDVYNDIVVLVITDPLGNKTLQQLSSSEQVGANTNGNTVDATGTQSFTATSAGNYQFSWLVLNATDTGKDSMLSVSAPHYVVGGVTYGQPIDVTLYPALVDTDGSETLSFAISGVPAGAIFSAGTNMGGGTWNFTSAELNGLQLLPASGFTGTLNLTETATSTELSTGLSASTSAALSINISATTATLFGTSGNETIAATAANTQVLGFAGNDSLTGAAGNDVIDGGAGTDTVSGGAGNDMLYGGAGNDTIAGGTGSDLLVGGAGNDTMTGGNTGSDDLTSDTFKWSLADAGTAGTPATDTINFFGAAAVSAGGDVLNIRDLLAGEAHTAASLDNYIHFQFSGGNTTAYISSTGAFGDGHLVGAPNATVTSNTVQNIVFTGVNLVGASTSDLQVLQNLINNNKLITD